ncbi:hypothetical protein [Undibacterium sp. Ren11W]|uniref:hypothetical protein n=1 Tax=Undibacterium sp. Ren11W TaxID=3413045 RepID=UPI003BF148C9
MSSIIYDKADKGREEIATRKYQLAPRLRSLLVMIDGKQSEAELLKKVFGLGLNEQSLIDLLEQEFIVITSTNVAAPVTPVAPTPANPTSSVNAVITPVMPSTTPAEAAARFQALYNFYNETIKSTLGLRGFTLQMKVERAGNLQDFNDLRNVYIEAILKAKGKEMARSLRDRLDQLLYADPNVVADKIIEDD